MWNVESLPLSLKGHVENTKTSEWLGVFYLMLWTFAVLCSCTILSNHFISDLICWLGPQHHTPFQFNGQTGIERMLRSVSHKTTKENLATSWSSLYIESYWALSCVWVTGLQHDDLTLTGDGGLIALLVLSLHCLASIKHQGWDHDNCGGFYVSIGV